MKLAGGPMIVIVSISCSTANTAARMPSHRGNRPSLAANRIGTATMMSAAERIGPHIMRIWVVGMEGEPRREPRRDEHLDEHDGRADCEHVARLVDTGQSRNGKQPSGEQDRERDTSDHRNTTTRIDSL